MTEQHPYIRYAKALLMVDNRLTCEQDITAEMIKQGLENGLNSFRVRPVQAFVGQQSVKYNFCREEKGSPKEGIFLSPNIISTDKLVKNTWKASMDLLQDLNSLSLNNKAEITMAIVPTAGEYLNFSLNGNTGRGKSKASQMEQALGVITTLTKDKPSFQYIEGKNAFNVCLIPDLPLAQLKDFISFYKRMMITQTASDLMKGDVTQETTGRGQNQTIHYKPRRPLIFKGNFPNPPRSSALGSVALLGAIGEFAKEAQYSEQAKRVLESLKGAEIYMIKYGGATVFTYNHHVIDLAKEGKLRTIVDSLYYSKLYNQEKRSSKNTDYQKFDLFTSRFLQLFNHSALKDFLAFRAEYPDEVATILITYFIKMEKIDPTIVSSARLLGKWLNKVAYYAAKAESASNDWDAIRKAKAKVLVELESSTFSAKTGDALIAQAITRAGRLSGFDAPEGAALFMEKTSSGELPLENAKNLLIAFSRLKNKAEVQELKAEGITDETVEDEEEDLSNE